MKRCLLIFCFMTGATLAMSAAGFSIWTTAQVKKTFKDKLSLTTSAGLHTRDTFSGMQLMSVGETALYRFNRYFAASAGYTFISYNADRIKDSDGNRIDPFWSPRHSFTVSGIASYPVSRVDCTLRLMLGVVYRPEHTIDSPDGPINIVDNTNEKLRTQLRLAWNIPDSKWRPYISVERFTRLGGEKKGKLEKNRYAVGSDYTINPHMGLRAFYLYQDHADDIELSGSVGGVTYKLNF